MNKDEMTIEKLKLLRRPFSANQISKLPKETKDQADARRKDMSLGIKCKECGGWHHKNAVHLDYVGHAALTDRLLEVDPFWQWEPVARNDDGTPKITNASMWIRLTVCGVTREGFGHAEGKTGGDMVKELIGDALRNAAMRFGCALDLWHKGDLHEDEPEAAENSKTQQAKPPQKAELAVTEKTKPKAPLTPTEARQILTTFEDKANAAKDVNELKGWFEATWKQLAASLEERDEAKRIYDQCKSFLSTPFDEA